MGAHRNTSYPPNRNEDKSVGGWAKSMHGDSLKPGDVAYGPAVVERDDGEVVVLSRHYGIVIASEAGMVDVMYATSEKSYNLAHHQSFTAEDKALSNGFTKDGHWSRSDFYRMPSELLERRGYVSDATWDKVQRATADAGRAGAETRVPSMNLDGRLYATNGRAAGEWPDMQQALQEASIACTAVGLAAAEPCDAQKEAVNNAKAVVVGVVQELLKPNGSEPKHRYSTSDAVQLADRILEAPDSASVVLTPQDKLRLVPDAASLAKCEGWERLSAGDVRELIAVEVDRARAQELASPDAGSPRGENGPQADRER